MAASSLAVTCLAASSLAFSQRPGQPNRGERRARLLFRALARKAVEAPAFRPGNQPTPEGKAFRPGSGGSAPERAQARPEREAGVPYLVATGRLARPKPPVPSPILLKAGYLRPSAGNRVAQGRSFSIGLARVATVIEIGPSAQKDGRRSGFGATRSAKAVGRCGALPANSGRPAPAAGGYSAETAIAREADDAGKHIGRAMRGGIVDPGPRDSYARSTLTRPRLRIRRYHACLTMTLRQWGPIHGPTPARTRS